MGFDLGILAITFLIAAFYFFNLGGYYDPPRLVTGHRSKSCSLTLPMDRRAKNAQNRAGRGFEGYSTRFSVFFMYFSFKNVRLVLK